MLLSDYITLDDQVTMADLVQGMHYAWQAHQLPTDPQSVDVVVHSLGGLVLRAFLRTYFPKVSPIARCVMLASPHFGSPLAHQGQAVIGRIIKGWHFKRPFEVGLKLLSALELGSSYTWQLALWDRYGAGRCLYDQMLTTILIGDGSLHGLEALCRDEGSDGVVRIANANLDSTCVNIQWQNPSEQPTVDIHQYTSQTALAILPGENHRTLTGGEGGFTSQVIESIQAGLSVTPQSFPDWKKLCADKRAQYDHLSHVSSYSALTVRVQDDQGFDIDDYHLAFTEGNQVHHPLTTVWQTQVMCSVHVFRHRHAYRQLYLNQSILASQPFTDLRLGIYPAQVFDGSGAGYPVIDGQCYHTCAFNPDWIQPNQTTCLTIILPRLHRCFDWVRPSG
jgi:hypothetical protein